MSARRRTRAHVVGRRQRRDHDVGLQPHPDVDARRGRARMSVIGKFQYDDGSHMPLSNFYPSPFYDEAGVLWPTVEHYFQAAKTSDPGQRELIRACATP